MRYAVALVTALLLAAGVVVLGALAVGAYVDLRDLREGRAAGEEAMATAREVAPDLLSYNYRTVEQDLTRAAGHTTGDLTTQYRDLQRTLAPKARVQKTVQQATVADAGVEEASPERVEVLLFMNMGTVKAAPGGSEPQQRVSQNRVRLIMVKRDSRWLVAGLSTLLGST
jgi:Mce-associated membrane protein